KDEWMVVTHQETEAAVETFASVGVYTMDSAMTLHFPQVAGGLGQDHFKGRPVDKFALSGHVLLDVTSILQRQGTAVISLPNKVEEGWDDELLAQANREENEPDELTTYESIGAEAELDSLIYDGSTYGTTTLAGSAEEQDYLGLPGLLDAEQMRTLLQQRQAD